MANMANMRELQQEIDNEIDGLKQQGSPVSIDLLQRRNSLSLISVLSNEVLCRIFLVIAHDRRSRLTNRISSGDAQSGARHTRSQPYSPSYSTRALLPPPSLLPTLDRLFTNFLTKQDTNPNAKPFRFYNTPAIVWVTHVCSHWRDVALTYPDLWTDLGLESTKWTRAMLDRSRKSELFILPVSSLSSETDRTSRCFRMCMDAISLIKMVGVDMNDRNGLNYMLKPAPSLQMLEIRSQGWDQGRCPPVFPSFLGGQAPSLRRLVMDGRFLPWTSKLLSESVNYLHISQSDYDGPRVGLTLSELLDAMERMPFLEDLHIGGHAVPPVAYAERTVALNRLKYLSISGGFSNILSLLLHFQVSDSTSVGFNFLSRLSGEQFIETYEFEQFMPIISQKYGANSCVVALRVTFHDVIKDLEVTVDNNYPGFPSVHNYKFSFAEELFHNIHPLDAAESLFQAIDFHKVESLDIGIPITSEIWLDYFGILPNLRDITSRKNTHELIAALQTGSNLELYRSASNLSTSSSDVKSEDGRMWLPFPALSILQLDHLNIKEMFSYGNLSNALKHRREAGLKIQKLHLINFVKLNDDRRKILETNVGEMLVNYIDHEVGQDLWERWSQFYDD